MRKKITERSPKRQLRRDYWYVRLSLPTITTNLVQRSDKLDLPPEYNHFTAGESGLRCERAEAQYNDLYTNVLLASPKRCEDLQQRFDTQLRRAVKKAGVVADTVELAITHTSEDDCHVRTQVHVKVTYYVQQFFMRSKPSHAITRKGL